VVDSAPTRGTRSRAGNAMGRTREAALAGAVRAVAKYGARKTTMGDIATLAGIAKATLYNHFRTKPEVYRATVAAEVDAIATVATARLEQGLEAALAEAARLVGEHPAVRRIANGEPETIAALASIDDGTVWKAAHDHVAGAIRAAGFIDAPASVDLVLRYLASQLLTPSDDAARAGEARLLAVALGYSPQVIARQAGSAGTSTSLDPAPTHRPIA
jgi:AcrR family transcriptional regulator